MSRRLLTHMLGVPPGDGYLQAQDPGEPRKPTWHWGSGFNAPPGHGRVTALPPDLNGRAAGHQVTGVGVLCFRPKRQGEVRGFLPDQADAPCGCEAEVRTKR